MKKLLLVMLVPVLVLGLFSCGKLLDAEMMPFELHGSWEDTTNDLILVLTGNQATIKGSNDQVQPAAYRVEVTPTKMPDSATDEMTMKFVGFKDKKAVEIATAKFTVDDVDNPTTITFGEVKRADDAVSYLLPIDGSSYAK
jgi:hypothetical protein